MSATEPNPREDRHAEAVTRSLRLADEAAERADWVSAIGWVEAVMACGDELPDEFCEKRARWRAALESM